MLGRSGRPEVSLEPPCAGEEHPWANGSGKGCCAGARDRELLSLYYLEDWDYNEISTVSDHIRRAANPNWYVREKKLRLDRGETND